MTGCYAQRVPAEVASLPGVSAVIGNSHKASLARIAAGTNSEKGGYEKGSFVPVSSFSAWLIAMVAAYARVYERSLAAAGIALPPSVEGLDAPLRSPKTTPLQSVSHS